MELIAIGVVRSAHGVKGELAVRSFSTGARRLDDLRQAVLRKGRAERLVKIEWARPAARDLLVKAEGIDTREAARELVGFEMWVGREHAAPLGKGEYYTADLCRCSLYYGEELIGDVRSVWDTGNGQLLVVNGSAGREILVPFIGHFIGEVDVEKGRILLLEDDIVR